MGEVTKRIDRIDKSSSAALRVAGIVTTMVAAIAETAAIFAILKALGLVH